MFLQDPSQVQPGEDRGASCSVAPAVLLAGVETASQLLVDTRKIPLACPAMLKVRRELFTWHEEVKQCPQL